MKTPDCATTSEMETFEALRRRGVAYAFVDILTWEIPGGPLLKVIKRQLCSRSFLLTELFSPSYRFAQRSCNRRSSYGRCHIVNALSSYDVGFHLMPLPKPVQPSPPPKSDPVKQQDQWWNPNQYHRWNPYKGNKGHKGKVKGFQKGKDRAKLLPRALQNRDNVSTDPLQAPHAESDHDCQSKSS